LKEENEQRKGNPFGFLLVLECLFFTVPVESSNNHYSGQKPNIYIEREREITCDGKVVVGERGMEESWNVMMTREERGCHWHCCWFGLGSWKLE
jgi:hypothetical protein